MKNFLKSLLFIVFVLGGVYSSAQTGIKGTVKDAEFNSPLPGAAIMIKGSSTGTISDVNGEFLLETSAGTFDILISFLGYQSKTMSVTVNQGKLTYLGDIILKAETQNVNEIYIVADRAKERETPVAISNIEKKQIEQQLGSRDIPLIMNTTPSVYSTAQGGGAGDARINVRGFNQRNVAIMINGVPVNDMENGWVYWSNWDGIADATSSIQMQRGLSAVNLATPSIGGTMNIITSPAEKKAGGSAKFEYGAGNFMKATLSGNTGLINDKFALSASIVRKTGVGVIDATWTDAWAYYLGATYKLNKKNKIEIFVMGAPQRHGQNLYKQNIAAYSHEYATELGFTQAALDAYPEADASIQYPGYEDAKSGRYYNQNWNVVSSTYTGQQWWNGKARDRYSSDFINERENYYHKPLMNLNWYSHFSDKVSLYTVAYYSGGKGGGSGTYGSMRWNYHEGITSPSRFVMWDATIAQNQNSTTGSIGILRNSVNEQWTVGLLSKLKILVSENFKTSIGIDWRTAEIDHFREVRDLLGGDYYFWDGDDFDNSDHRKGLGDKIAYNFTNTVDWIGYYAQGEYTKDKITAYATFGHSFIKYTYTNHFVDDGTGNKLFAQTDYLPGYQIKGGLSYRPTSDLSFFGNYGYISKAPILDNIINDRDGTVADEVKNEIFNAFEFGAIYKTPNKMLDLKANYYNTSWKDRAKSIGITNEDGTEGFVFVNGMDQLHKGFEIEANYHPFNFMAIGLMASFGNWEHTNDVSGVYYTYDDPNNPTAPVQEEYNYYVNGLKVGDAPQTQFGAMLTVYPVKDLRLQLDYRHYKNYYSDWDPFSRTDPNDRAQVWKAPAYHMVDFHFSYDFPIKSDKWDMELTGHVFNVLDEIYIQDATDESRYNAFNGGPAHSAMRAEVFLGLPRTFNFGLKVTF